MRLSPGSFRIALVALATGWLASWTVVGCVSSPLGPGLNLNQGSAIETGVEALEAPPIRDVEIDRKGDAVRFTINLLPGPSWSRLPLDPAPTEARSWAFRLALDTDQSNETGLDAGSDFALLPTTGGTMSVARGQSGDWQETGRVAYTLYPGRKAFEVPASLLGGDDGWMDYVLGIFEVAPGQDAGTGRMVARYTGSNRGLPGVASHVPVVTSIRSQVRGDSLFIVATFAPRKPLDALVYDPFQSGGWMLQLFLNTDQSESGYWLGFDYLVRGGEYLEERSLVCRRITLGTSDPSGWGPVAGRAEFRVHPRSLVIAVPLSVVGSDDGMLDYALETYATVPCPECTGGVSQIYLDDYFGSTAPRSGHGLAWARWPRPDVEGANRL